MRIPSPWTTSRANSIRVLGLFGTELHKLSPKRPENLSLTAVCSRPSSVPPVSFSHPALVLAVAVAAGLTAAGPFAQAEVPDGSAPSWVVPDDCSEEERTLADSAAVPGDSAPRGCSAPAAGERSVPEMKADPIALAAERAVLVQLAPVPPDLELVDLNWADSALSDTLAAPVAEWPVVSLVAPDDTPEPLTVRLGWPESVDSVVDDNSAQLAAPSVPVAALAEDGCWLPGSVALLVPDDSSPESE